MLEVDEDRTVFKPNSDLHQQLSDFIKCVNDEDVVNRDIINSIRNKIWSLKLYVVEQVCHYHY